MSGASADDHAGKPRRRPARRVAVSVSVLALAAGGVAWLSRVPIATGVIDRELARRGVPARYRIADLGFGRQRLTGVVLGDPRDPDLVADWVETVTDFGLDGPRLVAVRAGSVRARARWRDGRLRLGAIDRLLPASTGGGFTLPAIDLSLADARLRVETPYGVAGVSLAGAGRLDRGFAGSVALAAERLGTRDCAASRIAASGALRSIGADGKGGYGLAFDGPLRAATLACAGTRVAAPRLDASARLALGRWPASTLRTRVSTGAVAYAGLRATAVEGMVAIADPRAATLRLTAREATVAGASAGSATLDGRLTRGEAGIRYAGSVAAAGADVRALLPRWEDAAAGSPVDPLVRRASTALRRAAANLSGRADVDADVARDGWRVAAADATLAARSGARATLRGTIMMASAAGVAGAGRVSIAGGGLPSAAIDLSRPAFDSPLRATARVAPYAAEGAALALAPVEITARDRGWRVDTVATLTGPLAGGRIDRLVVPLDVRGQGGRIAANPACTPIAFRSLSLSGLSLDSARLTACPTGAALVEIGDGVRGGARIAAPRLSGRLGDTPVTLAASGATVALAGRGFTVADLQARLGRPGAVTRLDLARLDGAVTAEGLAGTITGGAGQIGNVPLLLSDATGRWEFAGGRLALLGDLTVTDAAAQPRFNPLSARDAVVGLADGRIGATARLVEPVSGIDVARVAIGHRLASGSGGATIAVPGLVFGDALQPDRLTPLTFGVIADVKGEVTGEGRIEWDARGVTSTGTFATEGTDLAAAFGPVTGLSGTIRFTDLLALESAPGQVATVASINTGVEVTDGRIVYQVLPGPRVKVESGRWPFAGGTLTLDPTTLDFAQDSARRLTFRVDGMQAGQFLQQFDFDNLNATGTFDGVLPMVFDQAGGRVEGGRLVARAGGGSVAYLGELTEKQLGFWGDFAFQALRSLSYRSLDVSMNGPLAGEMVTEVGIAGVRQGQGAKSNIILRRLTRLPIRFDIRIRAPFRGLIDSAASFYDPQRLVERNLQQLLEEQERRTAIQPKASENVP
ncbi:YdbH domain-containing protein [Sphingomonas corticis]|jgi:hypothetical protein|uniref:Dicarboxylate transport domain-containing protein n=1 Tax=Sphingomonas corticis TaxID=2722791 RepID=A0ABX1CJW8_9SPHN|nr:YdbH domain-containing protein [Sphingomonas corticis]NJR77058.1 hypothetical protein [Sphingomonas corticis]